MRLLRRREGGWTLRGTGAVDSVCLFLVYTMETELQEIRLETHGRMYGRMDARGARAYSTPFHCVPTLVSSCVLAYLHILHAIVGVQ